MDMLKQQKGYSHRRKIRHKFGLCAFVLFFCSLISSIGWTADEENPGVSQTETVTETGTEQQPIQTLEPVVISATRSERKVEDLPASVSVVPSERIQETPGLALDNVMRSLPSVDLGSLNTSYQQHPTANMPSMRGLMTGITPHMLVMVDGVPINDAFSGFIQWSRVPNELVDHIEVVRGGGSNLWGTYATGGVVNIITRQPKAKETSLEVGYGSFNTARLNAFVAGAVLPSIKVGVNVNTFSTDSFQPTTASERMPLDLPPAYDASNIKLLSNFAMSPSLSGYLRGDYFQNHQQLLSPLAKNHQKTWDLTGGGKKKLGPGDLEANAFYHHGNFVTDNTNPITAFRVDEYLANRHTTDADDYGASVQWTQSVLKIMPQFSLGLDFRLVDGEDTGDNFDSTGAFINTDIGSGKQRSLGAYVLVSVLPLPALEVLASLRWDRWTNYDGLDTAGGGAQPDKTASAVSPKVSLRYQLISNLALRGAVYKAFNAPNLDNLYRSYSAGGFIGLPNSQLNPEHMQGGEVGFDIDTEKLRVQVTTFQNTVKDLITYRNLTPAELPPGFAFGSQNINAPKLRSRGVELETTYQFDPKWSLDGSYTHVNSVLTDNPLDPTTVGTQLDGVFRNAASVGLSYRQSLGLSGGVRLRYTGPFTTLFKKRPLDAVTVVDASGSYAINKTVSVFATVANLFNADYIADDSGFTAPQRGTPFSVFMGVRSSF
jgi:outer membrane receptor protein involved in Fe transport